MQVTARKRTEDELRRRIEDGTYPQHTRLPAERELCKELGIARTTLRKSLALLEAQGLITRHVGHGTFVGGRPPANASMPPAKLLSGSPWEVMEARTYFEPVVASLAALRATEEEITNLQYCIGKLYTVEGWQNRDHWDLTLHQAIAGASHNAVLSAVVRHLLQARSETTGWPEPPATSRTESWQTRSNEQHARIVDAISARDPGGAAQKMREHLAEVQARYFDATGHLIAPPR